MSIAAVRNNGVNYCQETAGKSGAEQKPFCMEESKDADEQIRKSAGEAPEGFTGASLMDFLKSSDAGKDQRFFQEIYSVSMGGRALLRRRYGDGYIEGFLGGVI